MTEDLAIWAYAVADSIEREWLDGMTGVGGHPVHTAQGAGLAAAVTAVPLDEYGEEPLRHHLEDIAWLEATAVTHHRVIETIARHRRVVPMRLATMYHSDASVAAMLTARRAELTAALGRVEGRTEWGVKVYAAHSVHPAIAAESPAAAPAGPAPSSPGIAYLRRRRTELSAREDARRDAVASAEDIHSSLRPLTVAAQLRVPQDPRLTGMAEPMILNGAYLVQDTQSAEFAAAVHNLAGRHPGVRIELTGPWPPYSFAAVDGLGAAV